MTSSVLGIKTWDPGEFQDKTQEEKKIGVDWQVHVSGNDKAQVSGEVGLDTSAI